MPTGVQNDTGKGPVRIQWAVWKASLAVAVGDLIYQDPNDTQAVTGFYYDKSASNFAYTSTNAITLRAFKANFKGVSTVRRTTLQTTDGGQSTDGGIAASGEFTFPCAALGAMVPMGTYVAPYTNGTTISNQQVQTTTDAMQAIGRVTRPALAGATQLTFEVEPYTFDGGVVPDASIGVYATLSNTNNVTAHAGGGQASGVLVNTIMTRVTTVATAGDSLLLPPSTNLAGCQLVITNAAATNSMNVFPATGEIINAQAANAAFAVAAGKTAEFYCFAAGQWHVLLSA